MLLALLLFSKTLHVSGALKLLTGWHFLLQCYSKLRHCVIANSYFHDFAPRPLNLARVDFLGIIPQKLPSHVLDQALSRNGHAITLAVA